MAGYIASGLFRQSGIPRRRVGGRDPGVGWPRRLEDGGALPPPGPQGCPPSDGANQFRRPGRQRAGAPGPGQVNLLNYFNTGVCNGLGNEVESMIRTSRTNPTIAVPVAALLAAAIAAAKIGGICPSVCPSNWDKRQTPFVSPLLEVTYEGRLEAQRRGQDSNLRTSYPVTDLANPRFRPLSHLSQWLRHNTCRLCTCPAYDESAADRAPGHITALRYCSLWKSLVGRL